ncbi:hypothetical protein EA004_18395 [Vibrio anguillarum]|uniref:Uncharacterized protein n=1 Tax=Vibrio anguillarum TaxID=55601 RepID=A0ABR9Z9D6_VIBAN|nr:hypothetical protein [Vibrio anguillarum]MBF4246976.1 hypothetical protein [Vibrio anguillarum]MBF4375060.1 hypothetical protein [Vibrio anguillarum]
MDWFDKYQTFIAGLLGFLGVIATIRSNGKQNRGLLIEQVNQESRALRRALIEELSLVANTYKTNIEDLSISNNPHGIAYLPENPHIAAYGQLVPRFGLLDTEEIKKTMLAYQLIQELPDRFRLLQPRDSKVCRDGFITIERQDYATVVEIYDSFLSPVLEAIELLGRGEKTS